MPNDFVDGIKICNCCEETPATCHDPDLSGVCDECKGHLNAALKLLKKMSARRREDKIQ